MKRRGSVLLFSLIVMSVTVITLGGICSYYVNTGRIAQYYADQRSSRRVGAARALRTSMEKVVDRFAELSDQTQATSSSVGVALNIKGKTMDEILEEMVAVVQNSVKVEDETYELRTEIIDSTALGITVLHKGVEIMSVTIELENPQVLNTLGVFDYVYFVDNNGQLNSDYVIANGEVGTNGRFDLKGATVNGFIRYLDSIVISGDPHAWLQGAYNAKVAAEFKEASASSSSTSIEQARPTDPAVYVEGGATKSVEWPGGYRYLYAKNPYSFDEDPPPVVNKPTKPTKPTEPTKPTAPTPPEKPKKCTTTSATNPGNNAAWVDAL